MLTEEQIKELIASEVRKQLAEEKKQLAKMVRDKFLYTGQYAGAAKLMDVIDKWANTNTQP